MGERVTEPLQVETEPQFVGWSLVWIGVALLSLVVAAFLLISMLGVPSAMDSTTTTTTIGPDGTTETVVAVVASSPFATRMAQVLAIVGIAAIAVGAWLQAASMRVAASVPSGLSDLAALDAGFAAVLSTLADALAKLKAPVALVFVGTALLTMAGFISIEMLPAREGSALSNITSTTPDPAAPTTSPPATPTPDPTTSPTPGPPTPSPTPTETPT